MGDTAVKMAGMQFAGARLWKTAYKVPSLVLQKEAAPLVKVGYSQVNMLLVREKIVEISPIVGFGANN